MLNTDEIKKDKKPAVEKKQYRILILDDHPILRRGLAQLIKQEPDFEICGEAANSTQGFQVVEKTNPHLAIVDISLEVAGFMIFISCPIRTIYSPSWSTTESSRSSDTDSISFSS